MHKFESPDVSICNLEALLVAEPRSHSRRGLSSARGSDLGGVHTADRQSDCPLNPTHVHHFGLN